MPFFCFLSENGVETGRKNMKKLQKICAVLLCAALLAATGCSSGGALPAGNLSDTAVADGGASGAGTDGAAAGTETAGTGADSGALPDAQTVVEGETVETEPEEEEVFEEYDVTLLAFGDNLMHMGIVNTGRRDDGSYEYSFLFENMQKYLDRADVKIINQETILGGNELGFSGFPAFNSPTEVGDAIAAAGFNVVLHATNHAFDQQMQGIENCCAFWQKYPEILMVGINAEEETAEDADAAAAETDDDTDTNEDADTADADGAATGTADNEAAADNHAAAADRDGVAGAASGSSATDRDTAAADEDMEEVREDGVAEIDGIPCLTVEGVTFAVLNYTYGPNMETLPSSLRGHLNMLCAYNEQSGAIDFTTLNPQVPEDIRVAREVADIVVVCPHWGTEYVAEPSSYQRDFAQQMADAGADVIIGTHPHVPQPVEWITAADGSETLCYYSLGNYVSTQKQALSMLEGMAWVVFHVDEEGVTLTREDSGVLPLVCHYTSGPVRFGNVYALEDYTEELAQRHGIWNYGGVALHLDYLQEKSGEIFGDMALPKQDILDRDVTQSRF